MLTNFFDTLDSGVNVVAFIGLCGADNTFGGRTVIFANVFLPIGLVKSFSVSDCRVEVGIFIC